MTLPNPYLTPMPTPNQIPVWLTTLILFSRSHKGQTQPLYSKKIKFTGTMRFLSLFFPPQKIVFVIFPQKFLKKEPQGH